MTFLLAIGLQHYLVVGAALFCAGLIAVLSRRKFVRAPWLVQITPFLMGAFPRPVTDVLSGLFGVTTGMQTWTGRRDGSSGPPR